MIAVWWVCVGVGRRKIDIRRRWACSLLWGSYRLRMNVPDQDKKERSLV